MLEISLRISTTTAALSVTTFVKEVPQLGDAATLRTQALGEIEGSRSHSARYGRDLCL